MTAIIRRRPIRSLNHITEKISTKIGEVKSPAPASAIGIIGITPKYNSIAVTIKAVRTNIGFQYRGNTEIPRKRPRRATNIIANIDLLKWNWPTPTRSETSKVKLSENPKTEIPQMSSIAPRVAGLILFNQSDNLLVIHYLNFISNNSFEYVNSYY